MAVGSAQELEIYRQEGTRVLDLGGRFACPGFNDAHVQDLAGYLNTADVDLYGVTSMEEIQNRIRAVLRQQNQPMDIWLVARGWDQSILTDVEGVARQGPSSDPDLDRPPHRLLPRSAAMPPW